MEMAVFPRVTQRYDERRAANGPGFFKMKRAFVECCFAAIILLSSGGDAGAAGCPGDASQSHGPDVVVANISGPSNYRAAAALEALTFGSDACNLGDQQVLWDACPANTHPVFGGNLYKWHTVNSATRFEQIGQSWLKHAASANQDVLCCSNCQPSGTFARLGIGCSDPYSSFLNGTQSGLGPKYPINAHTGAFPTGCPLNPSGGNTGRLEVEISDLVLTNGGAAATTRYFGQCHYVTPDDAVSHNQDNNASYREIITSLNGSDWNFGLLGGTQRETPAIRAWKTLDTGVVETDVHVPEDDGFPALIIVAAKATDLGNGFWHYEYAINNLNSDRSIGSFSVPCSIYSTVHNVGFHDVAYRGGDGGGGVNYDGTDWPGSFAGGAVTWATTPFAVNDNANSIRWGTLYNFRFDANLPPAPSRGNVTLGQFKVVTDVAASTAVPSSVICTKADVNADGVVDGGDISVFAQLYVNGAGTPAQMCAGDVQATPNGAIDDADVAPFADCLLNGGCP